MFRVLTGRLGKLNELGWLECLKEFLFLSYPYCESTLNCDAMYGKEKKILRLIEWYKEHIRAGGLKDELYKWELRERFAGRPNLDAVDLKQELEELRFGNLIYQMARPVMRHLVKDREAAYRKCLQLLFDEKRDLTERIGLFGERVAKLYREIHSVEKHSHHHDERTMSCLLFYKYPHVYTLYKRSVYTKICVFLEVEGRKVRKRYAHYMGLVNGLIEQYLEKDKELEELVCKAVSLERLEKKDYKLIAQDLFYQGLEKKEGLWPDHEEESQGDEDTTKNEETRLEEEEVIYGEDTEVGSRNFIFYGPPGTGKTFHTVNKALAILENKEETILAKEDRGTLKMRFNRYVSDKRIVFTTFHQSMAYEDFIEGIKPRVEREGEKGLVYEVEDGIFKQLCKAALERKNEGGFVMIIDEINRGNVSAIFGELISLLEEDKRLGGQEEIHLVLPYSKERFGVPSNVYLIGTMNTADRSVEALDSALRRRFRFVERLPDIKLIDRYIEVGKGYRVHLGEILKIINRRIEVLLDRDHLIGHSYFMSVEKEADLREAFAYKILPLLQEYFYGDYGKIALVVGTGFCKPKRGYSDGLFADVEGYDGRLLGGEKLFEIKEVGEETFDMKLALEKLLKKELKPIEGEDA